MKENAQVKHSESAVRRCSSKYVFLKICQYSQKNTCFRVSFNKAAGLQAWRPAFLLKKRFQHRYFPVNIAKFLRTAVLWNTFCSLYFSEILCDDRILSTSLGAKVTFSCFWYYCFVFFHNYSVRIGSPWLFRTCFYTKIFSKSNFRTHYNVGSSTILIESLKTRNNCGTLATSPSNLLRKMWIWVFWMLCFIIISL